MTRIRLLAMAAIICAPASAPAQEVMKASAARTFVAERIFSYSCFDGTTGVGRINNDGSAAGTIRVMGKDPTRHIRLPVNTLYESGDQICATLKGLPFSPCFVLTKTGNASFRGAVSGMGFMYCDFWRGARPMIAKRNRAARTGGAESIPTTTP